jgi:hypothetical protein
LKFRPRPAFVVLLSRLLLHATVQFPDVNCHLCLMLRTHAPWDTTVCRTFGDCDASRRIASMGQCEVQIQADGGRAEPIHWKWCLIPRMHGFELACFRCGIPAAVASFLLIDCLVD